MATSVKFGASMSVSAFKALHKAEKLQVIKNPVNDKLFVVADGNTVAAVSTKYDAAKDKEFVELILEDGSKLWCLHNPNTANVQEDL